jgi:hypothetical protein
MVAGWLATSDVWTTMAAHMDLLATRVEVVTPTTGMS